MFAVATIVTAVALLFFVGLIASLAAMIRMAGSCTRAEEEAERRHQLAH